MKRALSGRGCIYNFYWIDNISLEAILKGLNPTFPAIPRGALDDVQ
jgi:hypothetical protein